MKPFDYSEPDTLEEALDLLHSCGDETRILAGGTDLVVQMKEGKIAPRRVIGLRRIRELDFVEMNSNLRIGPLTPLQRIAGFPFPPGLELLREAALAVGDVQIRNRATIGGNLANASPSADMVPALLALEARVRIRKKGGEREVGLEDFFAGPFQTHLRQGEILSEVIISPLPAGGGAYSWTPKRTAVDETLAGAGAWLDCDDDRETCRRARIALGSVAPVPFRARRAEDFLEGKKLSQETLRAAGEIASEDCCPRSRADYRRAVVFLMTEEALLRAFRRAAG